MSRALRIAGGFLIAAAIAAGCSSDSTSNTDTTRERFPDLAARTITVGTTPLRVVVAATEEIRRQGFRGRTTFGRYDGMLFEYSEPATTGFTMSGFTMSGFTMSGVPVALDIGFYDEGGNLVDQLSMTPCAGSDTECPVYRSAKPFRYALETLAGELPVGSLRLNK